MDVAQFTAKAAALGVTLEPGALSKLLRFRELLEEGNRRASLTTQVSEAEYLVVHALDALSLARALEGEPAPSSLIDVGSGAGIPAVPLAIAHPRLEVSALESTAKKCAFLREAALALGLGERFRVVEARAEEAGRDPALRDRFDLAVARAVAALPVLAELALPFVRPGGLFVAWKSGRAEAEGEVSAALPALAELGARLEAVFPSSIEGRDLRLVKVRKLAPTPDRYPRRTGVPEKRPLR